MKNILLMFISIFLVVITLPNSLNAQAKKVIKPSKALINFYYTSIQGKQDLQKYYQGNKSVAARDLIVTAVDIDKDRKPEYFVKRKSLCNGQDCQVFLYKQKGKAFVELFSAQNLDIGEEWSANGMRNLKSCAVDSSGAEGVCTYYKWDKNQYVVFKCMTAESEKSQFKAKIVPCGKINSQSEIK